MTIDRYESDLLEAYEAGRLKSVASKAELARLRAAARATALKDRRVNIRLSTLDLQGIQARALEEGIPYQTLISSVLHKYVAGRLTESARVGRVDPPAIEPPSRKAVRSKSTP